MGLSLPHGHRRFVPSSPYDDRHHNYWYHFGRFDGEGIWRIDKAAIKVALAREVATKHLYLCDVYRREFVERRVDGLPDVIDTAKDKGWGIVYESVTQGAAIVQQAVRVAPADVAEEPASGLSVNLGDVLKAATGGDESSKATERNIPKVTFEDVGGIDDILQTVREVIELPLKQPSLFERLGISPHRGILLYGPPGCGKTMIAKAIAHEVKAHFILVAGPEILSRWHGESERNLRRAFEEARDLQPSIIFFDEIDAIAGRRSELEANRLNDQIVNQLLTLMDGVESYGRVCVIASTNRPELIDEAMMRPGRFDYKIEVKKPTWRGCERILDICLRRMPVDPAFDRHAFAKRLHGLSGAAIAFVAREAAYNCLRRTIDIRRAISDDGDTAVNASDLVVTARDFNDALDTVRAETSGVAPAE